MAPALLNQPCLSTLIVFLTAQINAVPMQSSNTYHGFHYVPVLKATKEATRFENPNANAASPAAFPIKLNHPVM
jgi:hypothetical protein